MFLLDTDIISLSTKAKPHPAAAAWLTNQSIASLHLSTINLFEIRAGIEMLTPGKRRTGFEFWLNNDLLLQFYGRILPVSDQIALDAAYLFAKAKRAGFNVNVSDPLIAATARIHHLTLATLNRKDFQQLEVPLADF